MKDKGYSLHYYPENETLVVKDINGNVVKSYPAHGVNKDMLKAGVNRYESARKGTFIIQVIAPIETKNWEFSSVAWGKIVCIRPSDMTVWDERNQRKILSLKGEYDKESLRRAYADDFKTLKDIEKNKTIKVPYRFNDFGSIGIKYYKPVKDKNGKIDNTFDPKIESIESTYLHSDPITEWDRIAHKGKTSELGYSHGCIRLYPEDIDELTKKYVVRKFTTITIH